MRDYTALNIPAERQVLGHTKTRQQGRRLKHSKLAELLAAICVALLFTMCGAAIYCMGLLDSDQFHSNISIDDVPVGGMTKQAVLERFAELQATKPAPIQVLAGGRTWEITAGDVGAQYSVTQTIDTAWNVGRKGNTLQKLGDIVALRSVPQNFKITVLYNEDKVDAAAARIAAEASTAPVDAALQFQPETEAVFAYTPEVNGMAVDAQALAKQIKQTLGKRIDTRIEASAATQAPGATMALLKQQTQLIGACTTVLTEDAVRNSNIKLAAAAVNGTVLLPGSELSFNTLTGERTAEKGYSEAPTISNGKLVDEIGGGVCQVSSTVYDAALLAGLEVVERHPHTWPMYYVKAGLDAMVDYGSKKDMRLKNNTAVRVYLVVRVDDARRTLTAGFYGLPGEETITVEQKDYQVIAPEKPAERRDESKPIGWSRVDEEERKGYKVSVFRVYTSGGDTRQELLYNDYYPPRQGKVVIGTKAPASHNK